MVKIWRSKAGESRLWISILLQISPCYVKPMLWANSSVIHSNWTRQAFNSIFPSLLALYNPNSRWTLRWALCWELWWRVVLAGAINSFMYRGNYSRPNTMQNHHVALDTMVISIRSLVYPELPQSLLYSIRSKSSVNNSSAVHRVVLQERWLWLVNLCGPLSKEERDGEQKAATRRDGAGFKWLGSQHKCRTYPFNFIDGVFQSRRESWMWRYDEH